MLTDPSRLALGAPIGSPPALAVAVTVASLPTISDTAIPRPAGRRIEDPCGCVSVEVARAG